MSYDDYKSKFFNRYPAITDLRLRAKKRLPDVSWAYLESGTGDEFLLKRNSSAFDKVVFKPQFCKGHLNADTETTLFGQGYPAPIGIAPIGLTGLIWPKAEHLLAASAKRCGIPYCLSTVATETPETIGPLVGKHGWFQLYPPKDIEMAASLLERAKSKGFHTLVITADVPMASRRERTKRAGLSMPPKITPKLLWQGLTHPVWSFHTLRRGLPRLRTVETYAKSTDFKFVSGFVGNRLGGTLDWNYCKRLKAMWDGTVVIKGLLHPDDAQKALDCGIDGIWVSNHGGRQFNGSLASLDALPDISAMVGGQIPIIFDSGVRTGLDIMRALHLGADFIMLGRPFLYGVAAIGAFGADHVFHLLQDDLKNNMVQLGIRTIESL